MMDRTFVLPSPHVTFYPTIRPEFSNSEKNSGFDGMPHALNAFRKYGSAKKGIFGLNAVFWERRK